MPSKRLRRRNRPRSSVWPSLRVLLADDHVLFLEGVRALLEVRGLKVVGQAVNGIEAVRLAREHRPNVAVLDGLMPALNGVDAARQIAALVPGVGLILVNGLTEEETVRDALKAGVRGF